MRALPVVVAMSVVACGGPAVVTAPIVLTVPAAPASVPAQTPAPIVMPAPIVTPPPPPTPANPPATAASAPTPLPAPVTAATVAQVESFYATAAPLECDFTIERDVKSHDMRTTSKMHLVFAGPGRFRASFSTGQIWIAATTPRSAR